MTGFDRLRAVAEGQLGSFTRDQARTAGLSDRELRSGVHSRTLDRAGVRTYRSVLAPHTPIGDLTDLVLDVGAPCWVSGPTAGALHHFDETRLARPFHLMVLRGRFVESIAAVIHTTLDYLREMVRRGVLAEIRNSVSADAEPDYSRIVESAW